MHLTDLKHYPVILTWDNIEGEYLAGIAAINAYGYGTTPEAALQELYEIAGEMLEVYSDDNIQPPTPDLLRDRLIEHDEVINMAAIAREAGIPHQTLNSKLKRKSKFKPEQIKAILDALSRHGIDLFNVIEREQLEASYALNNSHIAENKCSTAYVASNLASTSSRKNIKSAAAVAASPLTQRRNKIKH